MTIVVVKIELVDKVKFNKNSNKESKKVKLLQSINVLLLEIATEQCLGFLIYQKYFKFQKI